MATIISRVVASPVTRTEYLRSGPGQKPEWTEKPEAAFSFLSRTTAKRHAILFRKMLKKEKRADGFRLYWFIHCQPKVKLL